MQVVAHGKWKSVKIIIQRAVLTVQPFATRSAQSSVLSLNSTRLPCARYDIKIIGTTISFAGNPKINAIIITPSSPISLPKGSKKSEIYARIAVSPIFTFARIQIKSPHGAAAVQALPSTNIVLSRSERIRTFPICGLRYGGSSRVYELDSPLRIVLDRMEDITKVTAIPRRITPIRIAPDNIELKNPPVVIKNIIITAIIVGKRPLQGIKLFVIIAMSLSRGESIILQPVTPQALHPSPIDIVIACFPQAPEHLKHPSRLNAIRGRYPKSSKSVNIGKNIAMTGYKKSPPMKKSTYQLLIL